MIRLGIPSKGRLQADTIDWFRQHGVMLETASASREYRASASGIDGMEVVLLSAGEIPAALGDGRIDAGVTGQDLVHEKINDWHANLEEVAMLGFGFADLVLAVPNAWVDCDDLDDLDAICADFRRRVGFRLRIATKYHRLVGNYLRQNDVTNFQLIDSQGATEGAVANEYAEMIADITSTGDTIRDNHLRVLGPPILHSQATLYARRGLEGSAQVTLDNLRARLT